jgi:hypothetical protein
MHNIGASSDAEPSDMQPRSPDPDRPAVEQLLDGYSAGPDALSRLLAAARATGRADQTGLNQALADFTHHVSAATDTMGQPKRSLLKVALTRLAAAKMVIIAAVAVLATGGIALAATTGAIPDPLPGSSHATATARPTNATSSVNTSPPDSNRSTAADSPPSALEPMSTTPLTASSPATSASAPVSFAGLCKSWLARAHTNGKADDSTAFRELIAAAGGEDAVDAYCTAFLAAPAATSTTPVSNSTSSPAATTSSAGKKTHSNGKVTGKGS